MFNLNRGVIPARGVFVAGGVIGTNGCNWCKGFDQYVQGMYLVQVI